MRRAPIALAGLALVAGLVAGCTPPPALAPDDARVQVVTSTPLLADLVGQVGGERVRVVSLVPPGADPHSFEPGLRDARDVVYADIAFSNYALLEEHAIVKTLQANLADDAPLVYLAEESVKYGATLISLVENVKLDTLWLGMRVHGDGVQLGATRSSDVRLSLTAASGPGHVFGYLTGTFGETDLYFDSSDGFDAATGYRDDTASLPADAHTHLSWAFTEPGVYQLTMRGQVALDATTRPIDMGEATFTFAVGVEPTEIAAGAPVSVLDRGHADITVNLDEGALEVRHDPEGSGGHSQHAYTPGEVIIEVPARARDEVPAGQQYRFLGRAGEPVYQLAQAVLGKHVHGEIDPHLWHDVRNAMAYVELIRDHLTAVDGEGAATYRANTDAYLATLDELDREVRAALATIPAAHRHLVTTHDAFGYLAHAYDFEIAGFVTTNPAVEPSLADRRTLSSTMRTLGIPAVFLEPNLAARSSTLTEVATEAGVEVCPIYSDAFDDTVTSYVGLMRFNASSLVRCLGGEP